MDYKTILNELLVFICGSAITWAFGQIFFIRLKLKKCETDLNQAFAKIREVQHGAHSNHSRGAITGEGTNKVHKGKHAGEGHKIIADKRPKT